MLGFFTSDQVPQHPFIGLQHLLLQVLFNVALKERCSKNNVLWLSMAHGRAHIQGSCRKIPLFIFDLCVMSSEIVFQEGIRNTGNEFRKSEEARLTGYFQNPIYYFFPECKPFFFVSLSRSKFVFRFALQVQRNKSCFWSFFVDQILR